MLPNDASSPVPDPKTSRIEISQLIQDHFDFSVGQVDELVDHPQEQKGPEKKEWEGVVMVSRREESRCEGQSMERTKSVCFP